MPPDFVTDDVECALMRRLSPLLPPSGVPLVFGSRLFPPSPKKKNYQSGIFARTASYPLYARQAHAPELEALTRIVIYPPFI